LTRKKIVIKYDVSGSQPRITKIILTNSKNETHTVPSSHYYSKFPISETIKRLSHRYGDRGRRGGEDYIWI
jgi:hypothetical protein